MIQGWMLDAKADDLPEPYSELARRTSVEHALTLAALYGGLTMYLPKLDQSVRVVRDQRIKDEWDGKNTKELAQRYNVTDRHVLRIVETKEDPNQFTLF